MPNYVARIGWPADAPSAVITWTAPTLNSDGTTIPETGDDALDEYRVAWYRSGYFVNATRVEHPTTTVSLYDLAPGSYEFFVTSITVDGDESNPVSVGTKVIS
jgi:hypothetical protein